MSKRFLIYGSLREGMYNRKRFGEDNFVNHGNKRISGYQMYDLGSYPAVVRTGNPADSIEVEVTEITDVKTQESIERMEFYAGYNEELVNLEDGSVAYIFAMGPSIIGDYDEVSSGDWLTHNSRPAKSIFNEKQSNKNKPD